MCLLAETAAASARRRAARRLYERCSRTPTGSRSSYPEISSGAVARYLGLLAAAMARWGDAERHFEDALEMNARIGARPWLAHTHTTTRGCSSTRHAPGNTEKAQTCWPPRPSRPTRSSVMHTYKESASMLTP